MTETISSTSIGYASPEEMGISSVDILKYVKKLEDSRLATHDMIIMRGNKIIYEAYWKPFHKDFLHRMYSVTKSFIAIAIGFLEQDGLIDLDDKIEKYFSEEIKNQKDKNMHRQTIRNMLMMSTAKVERWWFGYDIEDRVKFYFENDIEESRLPGTIFQYDSAGTFVLGVLVERLTGKELLEYLREKVLDKIGFSKEAYCLKCPGGHSWGDSALICKPSDLLLFAKFVMNNGNWNGEQILNKKFVKDATSKLIETSFLNDNLYNSQGYGYYFWRNLDNSFSFNGMGGQFAVCVPDKDIVFIINADNQGKETAHNIVMNNFFDMIVRTAKDCKLAENKKAQKELEEYSSSLKLLTVIGEKTSPYTNKINGKTFKLDKNPMGIEKIMFTFNGGKGVFAYTNQQGDKEIQFGLCENVFGKFPQDGYSDNIGTKASDIHYDCASSVAWIDQNTLLLKVQIIDKYFGNLHAHFAFAGDEVSVFMTKAAEAFLDEYVGYASGKITNEEKNLLGW